jgi:hypothetical protein
MSKFYITVLLGVLLIINCSFSAFGQFNKSTAIEWLNNKMQIGLTGELDTTLTQLLKKPILVFSKTNFTDCNYSGRRWSVHHEFPNNDVETDENTFSISLSTLNPNSLTKLMKKDRFYFLVETTNSVRSIIMNYKSLVYYNQEVYRESNILIGPFPLTEGLDQRVKSVLISLIKVCGGKSDYY